MKKLFFIIPLLLLTFVACERVEHKPNTNSTFAMLDVDNSKTNTRDKVSSILTPGDQNETAIDHAITQTIRRKIVEDTLMSNNGKNIKIITINGIVTLRGPVENAAEKAKIEKIVGRVSNIKSVDNQLEIKR